MPAVTTYSLSRDPYIDGLLGEVKWAVTSFTYSFPTSGSYYESGYGYGEPADNFEAFNATQQFAGRSSLAMFESISGLEFTEIAETSTQHADVRFAMSDTPPTAWAYLPSTAPEGGDSWFNNSSGLYDSPAKGNYAYATILHETGHALGLHHPHSGNEMPVDRDSLEYTVMSYRSYLGAPLSQGYTNEAWGYPQTLMMYDIAAIQHLYGPNFSTNGGNTTYSWSPSTGEMFIDGAGQGAPGGNCIFLTVWDGGGTDTYDFSNYTTDLNVDLRPGQWTTTSSQQLAKLHYDGSELAAGNIANALLFNGDQRSLVENAHGGSGDDVLTGNSAANELFGFGGGDRLFGGSGHDTLAGHWGDDHLSAGGGNDRLFGGSGHDTLAGHWGDDHLNGGGGDDLLDGDRGADLLVGYDGSDTFIFRSASHSSPDAMDTIRDFVSGLDTIDLQQIDANLNIWGNQAFSFINGKNFTKTAGELNFQDEILSGDVSGDGAADFQVLVAGVTSLSDGDFIL